MLKANSLVFILLPFVSRCLPGKASVINVFAIATFLFDTSRKLLLLMVCL